MRARAERGDRGRAGPAVLLLFILLLSLFTRVIHPVLAACPCLHGAAGADSERIGAAGDEAGQAAAPACVVCALSASPSPGLTPEPPLGAAPTRTGDARALAAGPAVARGPARAWASRAPPVGETAGHPALQVRAVAL